MSKGANIGGTTTAIETALPFIADFSSYLVAVLVGLELALAATLISGYRVILSSAISSVLGLLFLGWHGLIVLLPQGVDCGCGTPTFLRQLMGESTSGLMLASVVFVFSMFAFMTHKRYNQHSDRVHAPSALDGALSQISGDLS